MKKILICFLLITLTGCSKTIVLKSPNELLLAIKDYSCKMEIDYYSNKNTNQYVASQSYSSDGKYQMEFLDGENLKMTYENSKLKINSMLLKSNIELANYEELNKNPLFLSYFINTYFNIENPENIKISDNSIEIVLPNNNPYLKTAKLNFKNNLPCSLSYFDANGNIKVNIIYSEFTLNA